MHVSTGAGMVTNTRSMKQKEGCVIGTNFMGTVQYRLSNFLYEYFNPVMDDITGVFEAQRVDTNTNEETNCLAVVCAQLNPALFHDVEEEGEEEGEEEASTMANQSSSALLFQHQRSTLLLEEYFQGKRWTFTERLHPDTNGRCIESICQTQDHTGFFPGGYLHVFAMEKPAGEPILRIMHTLTEDDLQVIREGLVSIQKEAHPYSIALDGNPYPSPNSEQDCSKGAVPLSLDQHNIWYDRETRQISLPDRSVYYYYPWPRPSRNIETDLVHSEFWSELLNDWCSARSEGSSSSGQDKVRLCFRTRGMGNDTEWTMVDVAAG